MWLQDQWCGDRGLRLHRLCRNYIKGSRKNQLLLKCSINVQLLKQLLQNKDYKHIWKMEGEKWKFDINSISWDSILSLMPATTWDVLCLLVILPHLSKCCSDALGLLKCDRKSIWAQRHKPQYRTACTTVIDWSTACVCWLKYSKKNARPCKYPSIYNGNNKEWVAAFT